MITALRFILFAALSSICQQALSEEITREGAEALLEECQRQREENIAPLREQAIENCVNNQRQDRETCERRNRNYGQRTQGGTQPGLFWHLPDCERWFEADRFFRMNPRRDVYTFE